MASNVKAWPPAAVAGELTSKRVAAAGCTVMADEVPVTVVRTVSVVVNRWLPAVVNVIPPVKVWRPASAAVKV